MCGSNNIDKKQTVYQPEVSKPNILKDAEEAYKLGNGPYTLDDFYALPEDQRVELIDGWFYDMAEPSYVHQKIVVELIVQLNACIKEHQLDCEVMTNFDIQLDMDNKTMVVPDVVVFCNDQQITERCYEGAPEFAVEVLSPSNQANDLIRKRYKYENAGVKEYWIIDPDKRQVLIYDFANEIADKPDVVPFGRKIPVRISDGRCEIDTEALLQFTRRF